jgi:DNA helicase-2/ATP-dependent DNA helicase PcrA
VTEIAKRANFRSAGAVVDGLNRMRPELPQFVKDPEAPGQVRVFHTNGWVGQRQTGGHWGGDLPSDVSHQALAQVKDFLSADGWSWDSEHTKILMLTHRVLASEQGYATLPTVFQYNEAFTKKEHPYIAYFVDVLEPVCDAYAARKYGAMFEALGTTVPPVRTHADKTAWSTAMADLIGFRETATVGEVIDRLAQVRRPRLPDVIIDRERELREYVPIDGEEMSRVLVEVRALRDVPYAEIMALRRYLTGYSPFETNHGVKGNEFENVLVVIGRGWNQYNFNEMLELASAATIPASRQAAFERNRNLFYVAISRPKRRLALLFTQKLTPAALATLQRWFGDTIEPLAI